ncbi:unnamed protein product [Periconia digitata]|uniref:Uncharacterized protein n=1 Tax=Periconia digitata TaxID=1303443 RepID=A0A9W4UAI7_9PLEO|nr:unnamed protein product [Periconia digitata]
MCCLPHEKCKVRVLSKSSLFAPTPSFLVTVSCAYIRPHKNFPIYPCYLPDSSDARQRPATIVSSIRFDNSQ